MKTYSIPIRWESYRRISVEAETLQEAIEAALNQFLSEPDEDYINDSFEIDNILEEEYSDETYDFNEACENLD